VEEGGNAGDTLWVEVGVEDTAGAGVRVGRGDGGIRVLVDVSVGDSIRSGGVTVGVMDRGREEVGIVRTHAERIMAMSTIRGNIKKPL